MLRALSAVQGCVVQERGEASRDHVRGGGTRSATLAVHEGVVHSSHVAVRDVCVGWSRVVRLARVRRRGCPAAPLCSSSPRLDESGVSGGVATEVRTKYTLSKEDLKGETRMAKERHTSMHLTFKIPFELKSACLGFS